MFDELARIILTVRNVAAPLAGNEDFRTAAGIFLEQHDLGSLACGESGGEHSRRTATDDYDVKSFHVLSISDKQPVRFRLTTAGRIAGFDKKS
jgi:hypothetical protein